MIGVVFIFIILFCVASPIGLLMCLIGPNKQYFFLYLIGTIVLIKFIIYHKDYKDSEREARMKKDMKKKARQMDNYTNQFGMIEMWDKDLIQE